MRIDEFFTKWNTKPCDYDKNGSFQCTDVMRQYVADVLGWAPYIVIPPTGYAKNIFNNFVENKYFKKILNTPTGVPKKGDIVFWKTSLWFPFLYRIAGHVAIVSSADIMNLLTFDQNYPKDSVCHFQKHSYKDCQGWFSPKV
jgi:hypothetical protein